MGVEMRQSKKEFLKAFLWTALVFLGAVAIVILISVFASGVEVCDKEIGTNEKCEIIIGPTVNATDVSQVITGQICNISIYNATSTVVDNVLMENGTYGSGMHNYTFSSAYAGSYSWSVLCKVGNDYGRESGAFTVNESTQQLIKTYHGIGNYNTTGTSPTEIWSYATREITGGNLSTPNDYKADVSNLATSAEIQSVNQTVKDVNSSIIAHGDINWTSTASVDYDLLSQYVWNYTTRELTSFGSLVSDFWSAVLGSGSSANETITKINESVWYQELYCCG